MFGLIKIVISFLWKQKGRLAFILLMVFLFFIIRFPWNELLEKTVKSFQQKSPSSVQTDFDSLHLKVFPPGIEFKNLSLDYQKKNIVLDSLSVSIALSKWIAFKKAWKFLAIKDDSSMLVEFWKSEKILEDSPDNTPLTIYFLKGYSPSLKLESLSSFFANMKMSGAVKTRFNYEGSLLQLEEVKSFFNLQGQDISLSQTELKTPLGPLNLPSIYWKDVDISARLKEGELVFKTFRLGQADDDLMLEMKGSGAVSLVYGNLRLSSYNIKLKIDVKKNWKNNLLDLMFGGFKEDKGLFYRYQLRLTGQGNQVPNMEKIDEF